MFSNNRAVNVLAAARIFLFASRDVWFVVALPVYLRSEQGWTFWQVGALLAVWVIGYGAVQASAPRFVHAPDGRTATWLAFAWPRFRRGSPSRWPPAPAGPCRSSPGSSRSASRSR